jgi:S-adenosylmethionine decarboxylase
MSSQPDESPAVIGKHLLADLYGVKSSWLTDERRLLDVMLTALRNSHFNIVNHLSHNFPGEQAGVTAVVLLSESHATFHSYPEHGYLALDIFSCGTPDPDHALALVVEALQPSRIHTSVELRGDRLRPHSTDANDISSSASTSSAARLP